MNPFRLAALCVGVAIVGITGCSDDDDDGRREVSGTVVLNGTPLTNGIVLFEALDGQDTGGSAEIIDGAYIIPVENGLKPGKYLVRVTAGDGKTAVNPVNPDEPPGPGGGNNIISKELVPPKWNTRSQEQITVTEGGPNTFNFDIK